MTLVTFSKALDRIKCCVEQVVHSVLPATLQVGYTIELGTSSIFYGYTHNLHLYRL